MLLSLSATILTAPALACGSADQDNAAVIGAKAGEPQDVCLLKISEETPEDEVSEAPEATLDADYVAFTVSRDGSFGIGVDASAARAGSIATAKCREAARGAGNCGSQLTVTRGSWMVAHRCGDQPLIVTAEYIEDTEQQMINAEINQQLNFDNAAACKHLVTVDPAGTIAKLHGRPALNGTAMLAR